MEEKYKNNSYEKLGWKEYRDDNFGFALYYPDDFLKITSTEDGARLTHEIGKAKFECGEQGLSPEELKIEPVYDFEIYIKIFNEGERSFETSYADGQINKATLLESGREYIWDAYGNTNCTYPYYMEVPVGNRFILATYQEHHNGPYGSDKPWFFDLNFIEGGPVEIDKEKLDLIRDRIINSFIYFNAE